MIINKKQVYTDCLLESNFVKNKYRVLAEVELDKNDFPKDENGEYVIDNPDYFIPCGRFSETIVTWYGGGTLCLYISNAGWDKIKAEYKKATKKKLTDVVIRELSNEYETEVYFKDSDIGIFAKLVKCRIKGATYNPYDDSNKKAQLI